MTFGNSRISRSLTQQTQTGGALADLSGAEGEFFDAVSTYLGEDRLVSLTVADAERMALRDAEYVAREEDARRAGNEATA